MLFQIDKDWREHLAAMDMLRGSVNLRAMGGRDPFFEYKKNLLIILMKCCQIKMKEYLKLYLILN